MNIPEKLPIERIEDYHTHYLGSCSGDRLFWGYETFFFPAGFSSAGMTGKDDWQNYRREYIILHLFDSQGKYLETKSEFSGTAAENDIQVSGEKLQRWVDELGDVNYSDIEVELFQIEIDGAVFGLVPNDDYDEEYVSIDLEPSSTIAFSEPWDGSYDT